MTISPEILAGLTLEFSDREDGYRGIEKLYGLHFANLKRSCVTLQSDLETLISSMRSTLSKGVLPTSATWCKTNHLRKYPRFQI
ncbi:hypothetical protein ASD40_35660 [Paenibacillus sp. Root444D2]|nr:hypothetical protein ASD40_35660 [Paenibacillus sp. Root444D2]KRE44262.1 hypothetical protein ASG85_32985 [Paenibacillus sp. Soil724D2]